MVDEERSKHERNGPAGPPAGRFDPAAQSLADALRVSFRLLTVIMAALFVAFLCSGITCINPDEVGIKRTFGRVVGTADEGLTYTWPFPVGEIEKIRTSIKTLRLEDFWMHETPEDKARPLGERAPPPLGLRPGWDGALLTGDRNLLHVRLTCTYRVGDVKVYREFFGERGDREYEPEKPALRSVLCSAVIHASADKTAAGIYGSLHAFAREVQQEAQRQLDEMTGVANTIIIETINPEGLSWPLQARSAYRAVQEAVQERQEKRDEAVAEARRILTEVAPNYAEFVGEPWQVAERGAARSGSDKAEYDLIGQYERARKGATPADRAEADGLLERIDKVLTSSTTEGEVKRIIDEADTRRFVVKERVEQRAKAFEEMLPGFRKTPQFLLERQWAETLEEILGSPTVEKVILSVREGRVVIRTGQDPAIARNILRRRLKKAEDQKKARKGKTK